MEKSVRPNPLVRKKHLSWWQRMRRVARFRLVIPIKRSTHSPEYTARGVGVGMAWALTPSLGIQMIFCFVTWVIAKRVFKWDFSVLVAMAWTWTTNVITAIPCFYLFFVTGQLMLGRFDDLSGYGEFSRQWNTMVTHDADMGYFEGLWTDMSIAAQVWGVPLLLGCLPWSFAGGMLGYVLSLRFIRRHRAAKQRRRAENRSRICAATCKPAAQ